jgi:hypothetical protein
MWSHRWPDLNQMLFQWISMHATSSHMIKYNKINGCEILECHGLPVFVLGLALRRIGFWNKFKGPRNIIHLMLCKNTCSLYIHLAFNVLPWSLKSSVKRTRTGSASFFWSKHANEMWQSSHFYHFTHVTGLYYLKCLTSLHIYIQSFQEVWRRFS